MLLANDKGEDLSRMFRLFARLPDGLQPIAEILRLHIASLGNDKIDQRSARIESQTEKENNQVGDRCGGGGNNIPIIV